MFVERISSTLVIVMLIGVLLIYKLVLQHWKFFDEKGIKYIRGLPILGTNYKMLLGQKSVHDTFHELYKKHSDEQVIGIYDLGGCPMYSVNDVEIARKIITKDFDHFTNRRIIVDKNVDSIISRGLIVAKDSVWKTYRSIASPAFTGSKMKQMMSLINECTSELVEHINEGIRSNQPIFDMSNLFQRTVANITSSTAFGLKINSLKDENEFYKNCHSVVYFDKILGLKFLAMQSIPNVTKFFKMRLLRQKHAEYFRNMIRENMNYRDEYNIYRPDMIHLLMEARKGSLIHDTKSDDIGYATVHESDYGRSATKHLKLVEDDLVAQCMIYIFGGFSTVPAAQSFLAHELAANVDIQDKLYQEIKTMHDQLAGKPITYEIFQQMKYMDMCVSESLRRWTVVPFTDRYANKPYDIELENGKRIHLKKGEAIYIPIVGYHLNEKYFPSPLKFDPERFNDENKKNIVQGSFLPFGTGPRNCLGSRFALMEMKAITYTLVLNFKLEICEKTVHPIKLKADSVFVDADFWLEMIPRS